MSASIWIKARRYSSVALVSAAAAICGTAHASTADFTISGNGISGSIVLTYTANPNTGPLGTSPNIHDPVGSYIVTNVSGIFSDANIGLNNVPITGVVARSPYPPQPTNLLAPASFGFYPVGSGLPSPAGVAPGLSYDDLFYPGGSPQAASDYAAHGGIFDIYGIVFSLFGGDAVNLWSNGDNGNGVIYGVGVTDGQTLLDRRLGISVRGVPEPETWAMFLLGFAAIGGAVARKRANGRVGALA